MILSLIGFNSLRSLILTLRLNVCEAAIQMTASFLPLLIKASTAGNVLVAGRDNFESDTGSIHSWDILCQTSIRYLQVQMAEVFSSLRAHNCRMQRLFWQWEVV